jgi:hypothetical protein
MQLKVLREEQDRKAGIPFVTSIEYVFITKIPRQC